MSFYIFFSSVSIGVLAAIPASCIQCYPSPGEVVDDGALLTWWAIFSVAISAFLGVLLTIVVHFL
jgi:hypothetical protein